MRGGHLGIKRTCALRKVGVTLLAIHFSWASVAVPCALADSDPNDEQSIVILGEKPIDGQGPAIIEGMLEPITENSVIKPDLAEPIAVAQVPTLANPFKDGFSDNESPIAPSLSDSPKSGSAQQAPVKRSPVKKATASALLTLGKIEVTSFHGITPGISNRISVLRTWGDPRSDDTQAPQLSYRFDDLPAVNVHFDGNKVDSIMVELGKPVQASKLARKLKLQRLRIVTLLDEEGTPIERVYPERGVVLRYVTPKVTRGRGLAIASDETVDDRMGSATDPRIGSILIESIQAEPFLLRAEADAKYHFTNAIADLEAALKIDRNLAAARAMLSEIYLKTGKAVTAERNAVEAIELEPKNAAYRLQLAKCLRQLARYDQAVEEVQQVLETTNLASLVRAQALNEMGLLASLGSQKVARRAMPLHSKAIEIADILAIGEDAVERQAAKQLLVEAHLAVAVEISIGDWQQKDDSVPQWIERASALAEALISEDPAYLPLRLQVAVSSLAAAANLDKPINPLLWIDEAEETAAEIKGGVTDPLTADQFDWQLGLVYFHGSQIEHRRSKPNSAVKLGELAEQQLAALADKRDEMPDTAYLLGRLYFQIGAVHAVHFEDHDRACQWYDKATDRLLSPVPVTTMAAPQQHGDALVSMGVSYWSQDERAKAIEVTEAGVELIELAVESGLLESETLVISYSNLAAMHKAQGDEEPAAIYQRLAREITDEQNLQQR